MCSVLPSACFHTKLFYLWNNFSRKYVCFDPKILWVGPKEFLIFKRAAVLLSWGMAVNNQFHLVFSRCNIMNNREKIYQYSTGFSRIIFYFIHGHINMLTYDAITLTDISFRIFSRCLSNMINSIISLFVFVLSDTRSYGLKKGTLSARKSIYHYCYYMTLKEKRTRVFFNSSSK